MPKPENALQAIRDSFPEVKLAATYDENRLQISSCMLAGHTAVLLAYWHIGGILRGMLDDEPKYGKQVVERIAREFGRSRRLFSEMVRYHDSFNEKRVHKLEGSPQVEWSHVSLLCSISDEGKREDLLREIETEGMTCRELEVEVKKITGKSKAVKQTDKETVQQIKAKPATYFRTVNQIVKKFMTTIKPELADREGYIKQMENTDLTSEQEFQDGLSAAKDLKHTADVLKNIVNTLVQMTSVNYTDE